MRICRSVNGKRILNDIHDAFGRSERPVDVAGMILVAAHIQTHDLGNEIVDHICRACGHRPAAGAGRKTGAMCGVEDRFRFYFMNVVEPGALQRTRLEILVCDNACFSRRRPGHHGDVDGMGQRRIDAVNLVDPSPVCEQFSEVGKRGSVVKILVDEGVHTDNDDMMVQEKNTSGKRIRKACRKDPRTV